jgi:PAS domain S-box-containing protein
MAGSTLVGLLMLTLVLGGGLFSWQRRSASLRRSLLAERLAMVTRHANDIILLTDHDGNVMEANDRALAAYGYTLEEIRALPPGGLRPPETATDLKLQIDLLESQGGAIFETLHRRRDGSVFPVEVSASLVTPGERRRFLFITRDISRRKAQDLEIDRLNRLYAAHSQVNQAIVHADTRDALLQGVCRGLVEAGRFPMAWVGQPDPTSGLIEPIAHFGDASGYLRDIRITVDETLEGRGPTGTAIRENRAVVSNDFLSDPGTKPWHQAARRAGFRASIALPVRLGAGTTGALMAYAAEAGFFGAHEVGLIEEAALDVGFGLASLEREAQRAQAEEALSRSEERLRLTLAAGHQGLYDLNLETGEAMVGPEYATMLGHDPASFHETVAAWIERLHPEDREQASTAFADYIANRRPDYRIEFRLRTRLGDWKWILSMGRIVERTGDGRPVRMLGTHTDITDLKRAEAAVAASEVRYRRLFESAKDGILILDAGSGMVVDVNPFLIELLGFSREAFLDKAIWDLGFFRDIVANQDGFAELQNQEYIRYEDKPLETADGRRIDVEFISNVYLVGDRKVIQCNVRDITARRRAEVALRASLHEKEALLKEVHHRVKNNLQVITSLLRLETSRAAEPSTKMVLTDMQGRIRSMALLHETLYRTGNFARIDLASYLRQLATQLFRMQNTEASHVHLVMDLENVRVDIDQAIPCGLIVNELMTNCLKHAFADGRSGDVRLGLFLEADGAVRLSVSDTGSGLPTDFEARRGRSLGLQLVSDLIRQLAGALRIEPGPGAAFTVVFAPRDSTVERAPSLVIDEKGDSRSLLAAMVEGAHDAIIATTTEGTVTHWNPATTNLFGYTAEEAIGRSVTMLAPPGESELEVFARNRRALEGEHLDEHLKEEAVLARKDGSRFDCRLSLSCIRNAEGVPMSFIATLQDITDRKGAEEALRASEERYRSILNASPDAVVITDLGGRILIVTPMTLRMFGGKQNEDVLGRPIFDFIAPEDRDRASSNMALRLQGSRSDPAGYRGMRLDGGRFDMEVNAAFIRHALGHQSELVITVRDVTTRKKVEEALASSLREKEGLLKETHHRVKNNLALITSLMRLTAGHSSEPETRTVLKEMQDRIHSVLLLNETLYKTASYTQVKLADYLGQISTHVFRAQNANTGDVRLVLDLEPVDVVTAQAIPCGLIVNELLTNSLKHAFPAGRGGEVRVGLTGRAGEVQIRVSDNGAGLPANFDATRSESLGLQLISDLSKQLRGELAVGPASTFTITFPSRLHETGSIPEPPAS